MEFLYGKIQELGLGDTYLHVITTNKAFNLPYHNTPHLENVCKYALMGAEHYGLSIEDQIIIATAALYHDKDHTGSGKNDDINIEIAINDFLIHNTNTNQKFIDAVIGCIKATRYPYLYDVVDIREKIIRDADVLQNLFIPNFITNVVGGISTEANIPFKTLLDGQENFYQNVIKFSTDWAIELFNEQLPKVMNKVNAVRRFYNLQAA